MGRGNSDPFGDLLEGIFGGGNRRQAPQSQSGRSGGSLDDFFGAEGRGQSNETIDDILSQIQGGQPQARPAPSQPRSQPQQMPQQPQGGGLEDILGGGQHMPQQMPQGGSILDVIGAILGGGGGMPMPQQRPQQMPQQPQGGGLEDILGGILGGGQQMPQQRPQQPQGGGLEDILGGILGGGQQMPQQRPQQPQGGGLEEILGGILGGGQQMPQQRPQQMPGMGGGIMDIIGAVLGGGAGGAAMGANPILAPIVNAISRKLGLPPFVVSIGLSLLLGKLISGAANRAQQPRQSPQPRSAPSGGGLDLDDILNQIKGGGVSRGQLERSGVIDEIAKETGLGAQDAGSLAEEILRELGSNGSAQPGPRQSGPRSHGKLKDLLNTW